MKIEALKNCLSHSKVALFYQYLLRENTNVLQWNALIYSVEYDVLI